MDHADTAAITRCLGHLDFPASKQDVIATVADSGARQQSIDALQAVEQESFENEMAVLDALRRLL